MATAPAPLNVLARCIHRLILGSQHHIIIMFFLLLMQAGWVTLPYLLSVLGSEVNLSPFHSSLYSALTRLSLLAYNLASTGIAITLVYRGYSRIGRLDRTKFYYRPRFRVFAVACTALLGVGEAWVCVVSTTWWALAFNALLYFLLFTVHYEYNDDRLSRAFSQINALGSRSPRGNAIFFYTVKYSTGMLALCYLLLVTWILGDMTKDILSNHQEAMLAFFLGCAVPFSIFYYLIYFFSYYKLK